MAPKPAAKTAKTAKPAPKVTTRIARARAREAAAAASEKATDAVLDAIAGGKSLVRACEMPGAPNRTAFLRRVAADPALQKRYELATQARADFLAEQTLDISDDGSNDTYLDEEGNKKTDNDVVARSKLRIAARQWYVAKVAPKKYGDKVDVNHGVQPENPLASLMAQLAGKTLKPVANPEDDE